MIDSRRKKVIVYDDSDEFQIIVIVEIWMRRTISGSNKKKFKRGQDNVQVKNLMNR